MSDVLVLGGGLAGLAAAAALASSGHRVTLLEAKPFLGGRATSYQLPAALGQETIDNCQHILLGCCVNLLDFYRRLGVEDLIEFHRKFYFLEPGGRLSTLEAGSLPAPLHFVASFARLRFLSWADKLGIARALLALRRERKTRQDLDRITMLDWLQEKRQTPAAIERFWRQVLVSAVNEELDRMAAAHGFQVLSVGFLAGPEASQMGLPKAPLGSLYSLDVWRRLPQVAFRLAAPVSSIRFESGRIFAVETSAGAFRADHYISALPSDRLAALAPELGIDVSAFEHVPITGIHLWFDRPVMDYPHATLLDRTIQWAFNKQGGRYLQLVVSASRLLIPMDRRKIIDLALAELAEFLPEVRAARLEKAHVVKELRATFSARPGLEAFRPAQTSTCPNLSLAGDWTRTGWPATMEGAVRGGFLAAEDAARVLGAPQSYLVPDLH